MDEQRQPGAGESRNGTGPAELTQWRAYPAEEPDPGWSAHPTGPVPVPRQVSPGWAYDDHGFDPAPAGDDSGADQEPEYQPAYDPRFGPADRWPPPPGRGPEASFVEETPPGGIAAVEPPLWQASRYPPERYEPESYPSESYRAATYGPSGYEPEQYGSEQRDPEQQVPERRDPEQYGRERRDPEQYGREAAEPAEYGPDAYQSQPYRPDSYDPPSYEPGPYDPLSPYPAPESYDYLSEYSAESSDPDESATEDFRAPSRELRPEPLREPLPELADVTASVPASSAESVASEPPPARPALVRPLPTASDLLPKRVPAAPDLPHGFGDGGGGGRSAGDDPGWTAPELARIADELRRDDVPRPATSTEGFDVDEVLRAVRAVPGVRAAALRANPSGVHTLRLDLADDADPAAVSKVVARMLGERMGLTTTPQSATGEAGSGETTASSDETGGQASVWRGPSEGRTGRRAASTAEPPRDDQRMGRQPERQPPPGPANRAAPTAPRAHESQPVPRAHSAVPRAQGSQPVPAARSPQPVPRPVSAPPPPPPNLRPVPPPAAEPESTRPGRRARHAQAGEAPPSPAESLAPAVAPEPAAPPRPAVPRTPPEPTVPAKPTVAPKPAEPSKPTVPPKPAEPAVSRPAESSRPPETAVSVKPAAPPKPPVTGPEQAPATAPSSAPPGPRNPPVPGVGSSAEESPAEPSAEELADALPRPLPPPTQPGVRVVIDHVQVTTFGLEATVEVRLLAGERQGDGRATGPAVDGYVTRLAAVAAAKAIDHLLQQVDPAGEPGRCFVEHTGVVPFGPTDVAVVVVQLVCQGWVEQLAGSALVSGDPRQAMVRATLGAVNRRLEALLT